MGSLYAVYVWWFFFFFFLRQIFLDFPAWSNKNLVNVSDVNECGTQLVLCDANADCLNWFGSYSCRCRSGFRDVSRVGSGGTVCVEATQVAGETAIFVTLVATNEQPISHLIFFFVGIVVCSSGFSAETKGVYVLFFLLSALILMLLVTAGILYRCHHQGAFLVHCQKAGSISSQTPKREGSFCPDAELLPPPPPSRGYREGRPTVDLPLLRFNPLLPPEDGKWLWQINCNSLSPTFGSVSLFFTLCNQLKFLKLNVFTAFSLPTLTSVDKCLTALSQ